MEEIKRLTLSRRGYRSHLKRLFASAGEILDRGNDKSEADAMTKLTDLIEQLDRKRNILVDLDKQIAAGISDDDLEAEILESEEIQSEISATVARMKHRMQVLQAQTHSSCPSSPPRTLQTMNHFSPWTFTQNLY